MLFIVLELCQFIQKIYLSLLLSLNMFYTHSIGLLSILLSHILSLNLIKHRVLLYYTLCTLSFSLNDLVSSPILWFIRVTTIFLLYLRWSLISLFSYDFLTWFYYCFFFSYLNTSLLPEKFTCAIWPLTSHSIKKSTYV